MAYYMISHPEGSMNFPEEDAPAVGRAAHAVIDEMVREGVYVFTGGFEDPGSDVQTAGVDGVITDGPYPESKEWIGGLVIVSVPTREQALHWGTKVAAACRCAQEVRMFMDDPHLPETFSREGVGSGQSGS